MHSEYAREVAAERLPHHHIDLALHPMLNEQSTLSKSPRPSVLVAGQYKTERDLELLSDLGPQLRAAGWRTHIVGRGWPEVNGWEVDARFVSEEEFDDILGKAWVLLMPYKNYFQSGIAIRALEQGTLTVGPRSSFLEALYGPSSGLIVDERNSLSEYVAAFSRVADGVERPDLAFSDYSDRMRSSWSRLLDDTDAAM